VIQATNYPLAYFAERIAGTFADVRFLSPPDEDPAFWEPSDDDVAALQAADLILANGASYEKWRDHVSLPDSVVTDTSAGFADRLIEVKDAALHTHGKEGEHSHGGTAFTTWIDFSQARLQAEAVLAAAVRLLPDHRPALEEAASALIAEVDRLDADLAALAQRIGNQPLAASHPVYDYLARRYGLNVRSVLWEPEVVPDDAALSAFRELLAAHPATWMIWEGEPSPASVAKLEALGVRSAVFDPCGNRPESGDWLSVMRANIANLQPLASSP
jgi:zinc transport system substrate-binding protein